MEVSIGIHQCLTMPCLQTRRLDLIVMPILTLGFFCLRKLPIRPNHHHHTQTRTNAAIQSSIAEILPMRLRTVSQLWWHPYCHTTSWVTLMCLRSRFLQRCWHHPEPVQCRTADAIARHCSLRDPFQHDLVPNRPRKMVNTSTLPLWYRQYLPGLPEQLRIVHRHETTSWYYRVRFHPRRSVDYLHLVYQERDRSVIFPPLWLTTSTTKIQYLQLSV
jgi:hypothetical protein